MSGEYEQAERKIITEFSVHSSRCKHLKHCSNPGDTLRVVCARNMRQSSWQMLNELVYIPANFKLHNFVQDSYLLYQSLLIPMALKKLSPDQNQNSYKITTAQFSERRKSSKMLMGAI